MLTKLEEISLIARCVAADDRRAFSRLVDEYSPRLRNFLLNLCNGDSCMVDDLAQETFIKAYVSLRQFKGVARFSTWLYRIAINEYSSAMRSARHGVSLDEIREPEASTSPSGSGEEISHDLSVALKSLSDVERTLILLRYYEDRPIKEIVKITGLPEGTVKVYLLRARERMSKLLQYER